jgi:hypothetical protein
VAVFGIEQIQNGGRCHGNQGAKNVKFTPNAAKFVQLIPIFLAYLVPLDVDVAQPQEIHCQPRRITKNDPKLSNCTIKLYF